MMCESVQNIVRSQLNEKFHIDFQLVDVHRTGWSRAQTRVDRPVLARWHLPGWLPSASAIADQPYQWIRLCKTQTRDLAPNVQVLPIKSVIE